MNQLYYGDNLEVLRQHIKDESIDLIYLDPHSRVIKTTMFYLRSKTGHARPLR